MSGAPEVLIGRVAVAAKRSPRAAAGACARALEAAWRVQCRMQAVRAGQSLGDMLEQMELGSSKNS